jgi:hypothetical protein
MDPMTMMMIGSTAIEFLGASSKAKQDEARYLQNRVNAAAARDLKIQSLNTRMIQEGEAASAQKQELSLEALRRQERAAVAAGESGVSGSSVDRTVSEFETARLRGVTTVNAQTEALRNQIELEKIGASAEAVNRINSLPRGQAPNFLAYAVKAGAQAYAGMKQAEAMDPKNIAKQMVDVQTEVGKIVPTVVPSLPSASSISWSGGPTMSAASGFLPNSLGANVLNQGGNVTLFQ